MTLFVQYPILLRQQSIIEVDESQQKILVEKFWWAIPLIFMVNI